MGVHSSCPLAGAKESSHLDSISVIIPALNEEAHIHKAIESARQSGSQSGIAKDILVVDGGSHDHTVQMARKLGARTLLAANRGRAMQMNHGAWHVSGKYLLFLHADSQLPDRYAELMQEAAQKHQRHTGLPVHWGCFQSIRLDAKSLGASILESSVGFRTRVMHLPYGDQGIFVRSSVFREMGGYMETPLMEDVDLVRRLYRTAGPPVIVPQPIVTSARRWQRLGFVRTTLTNWTILCAWRCGVDPARLAAWYYGGRS